MSVFAQAPTFQNAQFGPATRVTTYRDTWSVNEGYVAADGTLYVAVTPENETSDVDDWRIGSLDGGALRLFTLPPARKGYQLLGSDGRYHTLNYRAIVFNDLSTSQAPVVTATDYDGTSHLFRVSPSGVTELPYREVPDYTGEFTLSSGDRCTQSTDPESGIVMSAIDGVGRQRVLLTREALSAATHGLLKGPAYIGFTCHHFAGQDFVNAVSGDWGLLFRIVGGEAELVTRGRVAASGDRHLLIWQSEDGPQGANGYNDYLEAVRVDR